MTGTTKQQQEILSGKLHTEHFPGSWDFRESWAVVTESGHVVTHYATEEQAQTAIETRVF